MTLDKAVQTKLNKNCTFDKSYIKQIDLKPLKVL